jgi:hypothetical protein
VARECSWVTPHLSYQSTHELHLYQSMHTQVTPCPSKQFKPKVTVASHGCPCVGRCWRSELPWAWPRSRADQRRQLVLHKRSDAGGQAEVWATVSVSLVISATSRWQLYTTTPLLHRDSRPPLAPPPPLPTLCTGPVPMPRFPGSCVG